jgi:CheY-like chemotaxis protein
MRTAETAAHVLLVDDDVDLSRMLELYLENEGFRVALDFNGKLAAAAAPDPPLLLKPSRPVMRPTLYFCPRCSHLQYS